MTPPLSPALQAFYEYLGTLMGNDSNDMGPYSHRHLSREQ